MQYNQINLSINGFNVLADSVSFNETSTQNPIFTFNNNVIYNYVPSKIQGSTSIQYFLEPGNEPNYSIVTGLLNDRTISLPSIINIGNVFITGYLNKFTLQLQPNALVKTSADYSIFYPFTGNLIVQNTNDWSGYDINNSSGLAHYWSAAFLSGNNVNTNNNILQLGYSTDLTLEPIYALGNPIPVQIFYHRINESLTVLTEQQTNTQYSGTLLDNIFNGLQTIKLSNISSIFNNNLNTNITIPLTGFVLKESQFDVTTDNLIFFNLNFERNS